MSSFFQEKLRYVDFWSVLISAAAYLTENHWVCGVVSDAMLAGNEVGISTAGVILCLL